MKPQELLPTNGVEKYAELINGQRRRTVDAILEVARLCLEADANLRDPSEMDALHKATFDGSTFSKFLRIARDDRLRSIRDQLPLSFSSIYEITFLSPDDFTSCLEQRIINPGMRRRDIASFKKGAAAPTNARQDIETVYAQVTLLPSATIPRVQSLEHMLGQFVKDGVIVVEFPQGTKMTPQAEFESLTAQKYEHEVMEPLRELVRSSIKAERENYRSLKKKWRFVREETDVGPQDDLDILSGVSTTIGFGRDYIRCRDKLIADFSLPLFPEALEQSMPRKLAT